MTEEKTETKSDSDRIAVLEQKLDVLIAALQQQPQQQLPSTTSSMPPQQQSAGLGDMLPLLQMLKGDSGEEDKWSFKDMMAQIGFDMFRDFVRMRSKHRVIHTSDAHVHSSTTPH